MWHWKEITFRQRCDRQDRLRRLLVNVIIVVVDVVAFGTAFDAAAQVVAEVVLAHNLDDLVPASLLHESL